MSDKPVLLTADLSAFRDAVRAAREDVARFAERIEEKRRGGGGDA